jgi:glycine cleavage system H protein
MPEVNGCPLPDELLYDVENQLWYRERDDGLVEVGMTAVAVGAVGGRIVAITPKRAGRRVEPGQACAVIESGKFVGPAKVAFPAEIVASNEMLLDRPAIANSDPYGKAWLVVVRPDDWPAARSVLIPGTAVAEPYRAKMARINFPGCGHHPS